MITFNKTIPIKEGNITITLTELEVKNLLLDLNSESKGERMSTEIIKRELQEFIDECEASKKGGSDD